MCILQLFFGKSQNKDSVYVHVGVHSHIRIWLSGVDIHVSWGLEGIYKKAYEQ